MVRQFEDGEPLSLKKALSKSSGKNIVKILPIVFVWTVIWFVLVIFESLFSSRDKDKENEKFSAENAAKTLSGYGDVSLSGAFFRSLQKGIRMIIFLILPAIVWDNLGFLKATKKGLAVFKAHLAEFATGYLITEVAAIIIFLPAAIVFSINDESTTPWPDYIWIIVMIYIAFAWSYSIYLEQMFAAQLYLWHMKWEIQATQKQQENKPLPSMKEIKEPSLMSKSSLLSTKTKFESTTWNIPTTM